jgi:hypothetical protein
MEYKFCNPFEGDNDVNYVEQLTTDTNLCGKTAVKRLQIRGGDVITPDMFEDRDCVFVCKTHSDHNQSTKHLNRRDRDLAFHEEMAKMDVYSHYDRAQNYLEELENL